MGFAACGGEESLSGGCDCGDCFDDVVGFGCFVGLEFGVAFVFFFEVAVVILDEAEFAIIALCKSLC